MNKINSQKGFVIPLVIAIVVILIGGGIYVATKKGTKNVEVVSTPTTTQTTDSDLKTYTNSRYGFSFEYSSKQFSLVQVATSLPRSSTKIFTGQKLIFSQNVGDLGKSYVSAESGKTMTYSAEGLEGIEFFPIDESVIKLTTDLDTVLKSDVTIGGKKSIKYIIGAEGSGINYYFIPLSENSTLLIKMTYSDGGTMDNKIFDQVVSTLKFSNAITANNSNWNIYVNNKYMVTFNYPKNWSYKDDELTEGATSWGAFHLTCFNATLPNGDCDDGLLIISAKATNEQAGMLKGIYFSLPLTKVWLKNGYLYFLAMPEYDKEEFNQIVSSLKFTN